MVDKEIFSNTMKSTIRELGYNTFHCVGTTCAPTVSTEEFLPGFSCIVHDSTSKYTTCV